MNNMETLLVIIGFVIGFVVTDLVYEYRQKKKFHALFQQILEDMQYIKSNLNKI